MAAGVEYAMSVPAGVMMNHFGYKMGCTFSVRSCDSALALSMITGLSGGCVSCVIAVKIFVRIETC